MFTLSCRSRNYPFRCAPSSQALLTLKLSLRPPCSRVISCSSTMKGRSSSTILKESQTKILLSAILSLATLPLVSTWTAMLLMSSCSSLTSTNLTRYKRTKLNLNISGRSHHAFPSNIIQAFSLRAFTPSRYYSLSAFFRNFTLRSTTATLLSKLLRSTLTLTISVSFGAKIRSSDSMPSSRMLTLSIGKL